MTTPGQDNQTRHTAAFRAAQPDAPAGGLAALAHAAALAKAEGRQS